MNIQELQSERDALQDRLRSIIQSELQQFQENTGVSIEGLSVYFIDYTTIGESRTSVVLDKVQVYLDI